MLPQFRMLLTAASLFLFAHQGSALAGPFYFCASNPDYGIPFGQSLRMNIDEYAGNGAVSYSYVHFDSYSAGTSALSAITDFDLTNGIVTGLLRTQTDDGFFLQSLEFEIATKKLKITMLERPDNARDWAPAVGSVDERTCQ